MKRTKLPARKKPIARSKKPIRKSRLAKGKKKSKLQRDKDNKNSKYWRTKAHEELKRLMNGQPCLVCKTTNGTVGHHMVPKSRSSKLRFTLANIIPLCPKHHTMGDVMAAHSLCSLVVERFTEWLRTEHPDRYAWYLEHEYDHGKYDYRASYEYLKTLGRGHR